MRIHLGNGLPGDRLSMVRGTPMSSVYRTRTPPRRQALTKKAGKSFEVQVGPDLGHGGISQPRMMEFFIQNLVMRP